MLLSICYYYVCVRECVYGLCVERELERAM